MATEKKTTAKPADEINQAKAADASGPAAEKPMVPPPAAGDREITYVLGEIAWLMSRSAIHRHLFLADLDWRVFPALYLGQARIFRDQKSNPVAVATWAFVSDEVDARLKAHIARLQPGDWKSGSHPWIIDVVAPSGAVKQVVDEVVAKVFDGKPVPVLGFGGKTAPAAPSNGTAAQAGPTETPSASKKN